MQQDIEIIEDGERVNRETGEIVPETTALALRDPYQGIAVSPFSQEQANIINAPIDETQVEIRPDGLIYYPHSRIRRMLNQAFGPGAWAIMPMESPIRQDNTIIYHGGLWIGGRFIAEAYGEQQYIPNNPNMTYATAIEAAKSNCLVRCAKDIGIANELWDPVFIMEWKSRHAVEVWCEDKKSQKKKKMWRKRTAPPIDMWPWKETSGPTNGNRQKSYIDVVRNLPDVLIDAMIEDQDGGPPMKTQEQIADDVLHGLIDKLDAVPYDDAAHPAKGVVPATNGSVGDWRHAQVHFGYSKGKTLGELDQKGLSYFQNRWKPDPAQMSAADQALWDAVQASKRASDDWKGPDSPGDNLPF